MFFISCRNNYKITIWINVTDKVATQTILYTSRKFRNNLYTEGLVELALLSRKNFPETKIPCFF